VSFPTTSPKNPPYYTHTPSTTKEPSISDTPITFKSKKKMMNGKGKKGSMMEGSSNKGKGMTHKGSKHEVKRTKVKSMGKGKAGTLKVQPIIPGKWNTTMGTNFTKSTRTSNDTAFLQASG
jgi:hypothetical protein